MVMPHVVAHPRAEGYDFRVGAKSTQNGVRVISPGPLRECARSFSWLETDTPTEAPDMNAVQPLHPPTPEQGESRLELFYNILSYKEPTFVFIDGANFKAGCDKINIEFDYKRFWMYMFRMTKMVGMRYYAALTERDNDKFVRWLTANGFQTFIKPIRDDGSAQIRPDTMRLRKNIDAELSADMAVMPFTMPDVKHVLLLSGDGDFTHTIKLMQDRGVRVSVISPDLSTGITSRNLIKQADFFVPLETFIQENALGRSILVNGRKVTA